MQKFYRLVSATPSLGPFYPIHNLQQLVSLATPWSFRQVPSDAFLGHSARSIFIDKLSNGIKFPGVMRAERPARGIINCPAKASITNHSTLTLDDGLSGSVAFEFVTDGSPVTPGNELVDIQAATTAAQVAFALATAIGTWVTAQGIQPSGDGSGFLVDITGARLNVVQAFPSKMASGEHAQPNRGTWYGKTSGVLGNNAIVASVPGEWPTLHGMTGGKRRHPGMWARTAGRGKSQVLDSFNSEIVPPLG